MASIITEEQRIPLTATFQTAVGNPAQVDSFAWESSAPDIVEMEEMTAEERARLEIAENVVAIWASAVGPTGMAQVQLKADADMGEGVREITALHDVQVTAAEAVSVLIAAGAPEAKV